MFMISVKCEKRKPNVLLIPGLQIEQFKILIKSTQNAPKLLRLY